MSIALSPWVIGQQIKAAAINLIISAVQEAQAAIAQLQGGMPTMEVQSTAATALPATTWVHAVFPGGYTYAAGGATGLTATANGIQIAAAGRYQVIASAGCAASTAGTRGIGVATAVTPPSGSHMIIVNAPTMTGQGPAASLIYEISFAAGDTIAVWVNSSVATAMAYAALQVRLAVS